MATVTRRQVALCVFAKPPRRGEAKTRLAAAIGEAEAARLSEAFIEDTWSSVRRLEWADPILATTDESDPAWKALPAATVWPQGEGDLGDRMERVLRRALSTHPVAMILGTDVPALPVAALEEARTALETAEAVIGPCEDGGFYLVGCTRCPTALFAGVWWGTARAAEQTVERLKAVGLTVARGPLWFDVDGPADLSRLQAMGERLRQSAPETARVLATLQADVARPLP